MTPKPAHLEAREQTTERRKQRSVGRFVTSPPHLPSQDAHFVSQGEQLDLLTCVGTEEQHDKLEEVTQNDIGEDPKSSTCPVAPHRAAR